MCFGKMIDWKKLKKLAKTRTRLKPLKKPKVIIKYVKEKPKSKIISIMEQESSFFK